MPKCVCGGKLFSKDADDDLRCINCNRLENQEPTILAPSFIPRLRHRKVVRAYGRMDFDSETS